ncbi:MAG: RhuM family protein [Limnohabitans sp.]|nr:RhuM family protein [Limnohabitans sp.]
MKNEIVLYRPNEIAERIEVRIDEEMETVWLTQNQMAELFQRDRTVITKHIRNVFVTGELVEKSNVQKMHIPNSDKPVVFYNLDVILSVGYRVNSKQGTQFRIWANKILKDYLLKGYAINNRMNRLEDNVEALSTKVNQIDLQINTHLIPTQGVFFDGQVFDAYILISKIIGLAKKSIALIDNYVDESVLVHLSKKNKDVSVTILTNNINKQLQLDVQKANAQYPTITIKQFSQSHDRFLIIDKTEVYHLGASLKDLGKKWFAFSKMDKHSVQNILTSILEMI